ncbi:hypothetical protein ACZ90_62945 [Streptomyces albus subsp. albus]|nr:hypothetical protein ACZ90_62945 [Streptomyces albus subsp. albus]
MRLPLEDDSRPPYIQAAEVLRREIATGRLKPGEKLPSARALQDRYGVASSTVQNALRLLKSEGLIYSVQGRGSYVRNNPASAKPAEETGPQAEPAEATNTPAGPTAESLAADIEDIKATIRQLEATLAALVQRVSDR